MSAKWQSWGGTSLSEWGEYVSTGTHHCRRVLWCKEGDEYDEHKRIEVRIYIWSGTRCGKSRGASATLHYFGQQRSLWRFKCRSVVEAMRKSDYRLRGVIPNLIKAAQRMVYRKFAWECLYRDGQPIASVYYHDWDLKHDRKLWGQKYTIASRTGTITYEHTSYGHCGVCTGPNPQFPHWIAA